MLATFLTALTKYMTKKDLRKEGRVYLGPQFEGIQSVMVVNTWQQELSAAGLIVSAVEKQERWCWYSSHSSFPCYSPWDPGPWDCEIHTQAESCLLSQASLETPSKTRTGGVSPRWFQNHLNWQQGLTIRQAEEAEFPNHSLIQDLTFFPPNKSIGESRQKFSTS